MDGLSELAIRPRSECRWDLVSLGEVMLRFDPGEERIARTRNFCVWEGGGEYNVARGLRRCFGQRTSIVTALADNPVGRLLEDLMLQGGVDLSHLIWSEYDGIGHASRNGIYFLERGFGNRAALGMMDRGHTAISKLKPGEIDWEQIFAEEGARWFHTGGVFCALSVDAPAVAREAMIAARRSGVVVSYDCNYRPSLWRSHGGRQGACDVNRELAEYIDVLFGHEGDLAAALCDASSGPPWHDPDTYSSMCKRVAAEFTNIQVMATTMRCARSAHRNDWAAFAWTAGEVFRSIEFPDLEIYDRVGGGDSFAAGLIYGLMEDRGMQWALNCGVAHGALAMTTPGDSSMSTLAEVEHTMRGGSVGVQR